MVIVVMMVMIATVVDGKWLLLVTLTCISLMASC